MSSLIITDCQVVGNDDCRMELMYQGKSRGLYARGVEVIETMQIVREFEPVREFRDMEGLTVHQCHELVRIAHLVHGGGIVSFPVEVPGDS